MVERKNWRINVKQKSQKKKCETQIQTNKIVSIKLPFSMSIQGGGFAFCCKISALMQIVGDLNLLGNIKTIFIMLPYQLVEVWKTYLDLMRKICSKTQPDNK